MTQNNFHKRIHKLSTELANQIAAGEVVERPLSVLKELLENSLDAGSTHIEVTLERGGIKLIRVQDDGCGILKEDLELALSQHATSKILSFTDLESVASFGFRGEALASMASVSRLSLSSYVEGQASAFCIEKKGREGKFAITPAAKRPGTLVEVRDLFYNTPARRKFLRSEKTETLYLEELFKKIALSHPKVAFTFRIDGRDPKRLPSCRTLETETRRVSDLCGSTFVKSAHYIEAENNGLKLRGWLGSPHHLRAQSDLQYFYVNGRCVRDKVVSHATRQAYQTLNDVLGKHPAFILFFELDPESVDVNVHPTKNEVRFREARTVHAFLTYSIQEALSKSMNTKTESDGIHPRVSDRASDMFTVPEFKFQYKPELTYNMESIAQENFSQTKLGSFLKEESKFSPLTLLSNKFLVCEQNVGLIIFNINKIKERLLKQKLFLEINAGQGMVTQPLLIAKSLLIPIRIKIEEKSFELTNEECLEIIKNIGFDGTLLGPNSFLIRTIPELLKKMIPTQIEDLIRTLIIHIQKSLSEKPTMNTQGLCIELLVNYLVESQEITLIEAVAMVEEYQSLTCDESLSYNVSIQKIAELFLQEDKVDEILAQA